MNDFRGVLSLQVESLLEAVRAQQESRCREIESAAQQRAERLLRDSRRELRERQRQAVEEERRRRESALLEAQQRSETAERRRVQARYEQLLRDAWPELTAELEQRWSNTEDRRSWCEMLIDEAERILSAQGWTIEHPAAWSKKDTAWLTQLLKTRGLPSPSFHGDSGIKAGLRIRLETACLDGTIDGLLARRTAIEAKLLAAWERQAREQHD